MAQCLCTQEVDPKELQANLLYTCRLIPPHNQGGVLRRIDCCYKAILYVILTDIQLASGALQTYDGHDTNPAKATIHTMREIVACT